MRIRILGLLGLGLALGACGNTEDRPAPATAAAPPASAPPPAPAPASASSAAASDPSPSPPSSPQAIASSAPREEDTGSARERLMRRHFREAAQARAALVQGNLHDAGVAADALGNMDDLAPIPKVWKPTIERLHFEAHRLSVSVDVPEAAAALADIGATCGSCHRTNAGPKAPVVGEPPSGSGSLDARMHRHAWAMERLWEGLFVPSDASWRAGADALSGEPFPKQVTDKGGVHTRSAASRFVAIVPSIAKETTPEGRAKVYASLIETCSACHVASDAKATK